MPPTTPAATPAPTPAAPTAADVQAAIAAANAATAAATNASNVQAAQAQADANAASGKDRGFTLPIGNVFKKIFWDAPKAISGIPKTIGDKILESESAKTGYDLITGTLTPDEKSIIINTTNALQNIVNASVFNVLDRTGGALTEGWETVKGAKEVIGSAITLNPIGLAINTPLTAIRGVNKTVELSEKIIGGVVEMPLTALEESGKAIDNTINLTRASLKGLFKNIPILGWSDTYQRLVGLTVDTALTPAALASKLAQVPIKITRSIKTKVGEVLGKIHDTVRKVQPLQGKDDPKSLWNLFKASANELSGGRLWGKLAEKTNDALAKDKGGK